MLAQISFEMLIYMVIALMVVAFLLGAASSLFAGDLRYSQPASTSCSSSLSNMLNIIGAYQAASKCV
ncbi:MAG: hypothetical protein QW774_02830 [Candidatus Micrarchaeaceae archaeon]